MEQKNSIISGTLLLAGASTFAYLITFTYESSFLGVFGISSEFINLDLNNVFIVGGGLLTTLGILTVIVNAFIPFTPLFKNNHPILVILKKLSPYYVLVIILIILFRGSWQEWLGFLIAVLGITAFEFTYPIFASSKENYIEKIQDYQSQDSKEKTIFDFLLPPITKSNKSNFRFGIKVIIAMIFLLFTAYFGGRANAIKRDKFLILKSDPEMIVIKITDGKALLLPFDKASKIIKKEFRVMNLSDLLPFLKEERLGEMMIEK